jgi:hypothetical protein
MSYEVVFLAKDANEARDLAQKQYRETGNEHHAVAEVSEISSASDVPYTWTVNCHPYGDEFHTINHYLKSS